MAASIPRPELPHQEQRSDPSVEFSVGGGAVAGSGPPVVGMVGSVATPGSPQKAQQQQQQGQAYEPMDKSASQTVKLNPKMELSRTDLLKLLSYMEAELQSRDVVIATLKTERVKNQLQYGRMGLSDPFLALQRDSIGGTVVVGGGVTEGELRQVEETQLAQLEHLIAQQRKAHQRMRHVLREAEKRHSRVVAELDDERRKHEHDTAQGDDVTYALEKDRTRLKQELDSERMVKKKTEKEVRKVQETLDEERAKQKQIILMLVEERKRLAIQYMEERKRSEDLAQILSEEKGRIDSMAEGLEEESKKSLQMEAELEKQLADFDTERQQMRGQLSKKEERIVELDSLVEKLQRELDHHKKQLQEAHNVAMFQQTLSVSPPRLGIAQSQAPRAAPPQLPAKPATLQQPQTRPMQGALTPPKVAPRVRASSPGLDEVTGLPLGMPQHHSSLSSGSLGSSHPSGAATLGPHSTIASLGGLAGGVVSSVPPPQHSSATLGPAQLTGSTMVVGQQQPLQHSGTLGSSTVAVSAHMVPPGVAQAAAAMSSVTKAVQLTATVNSVPVAGPTTGIARGVQPGVGMRPVMYSVSTSEVTRTVTTASKSYSVSENDGVFHGSGVDADNSNIASVSGLGSTVERSVVRVSGPSDVQRGQAQVVQVTPRVNVSASPGTKVITTTHGGKVTFHVTTNAPTTQVTQLTPSSNGQQQHQQLQSQQLHQQQQQQLQQQQQQQQQPHQSLGSSNTQKKPPPPTRSNQPVGPPPPPVPLNKPLTAPPIPPNKPVIPPKKDLVTRVGSTGTGVSLDSGSPISVEVKPQKVGPQTVKFGITISKTGAAGGVQSPSAGGGGGGGSQVVGGLGPSVGGGGGSDAVAPVLVEGGGGGVGGVAAARRDMGGAQVGGSGSGAAPSTTANARISPVLHDNTKASCVDSLNPELEHFHQLLISMAGSPNIAVPSSHNSSYKLNTSKESSPASSSPPPSSISLSSSSSLPPLPISSLPSSPLLPPLSPNQDPCVVSDSASLKFSFPSRDEVGFSRFPRQFSPPAPPLPCSSPPLSPTSTLNLHPNDSINNNSSSLVSAVSSSPSSTASTATASGVSNANSSTTGSRGLTLTPPTSINADHSDDYATEDLEPPDSPLDVSTPLTVDGMTALHLAAQGNNWQSIPVLIRCGAQVCAEDEEGRTPAFLALLYSCTPAAASLLSFPQSLEHTTKVGENYLHAAIKSGDGECLLVLLQHILATTESSNLLHRLAAQADHSDITPLHLAMASHDVEVLSWLCNSGLDLAAQVSRNPQLLFQASPDARNMLSNKERSECTCCVWLEGMEVFNDLEVNDEDSCGFRHRSENVAHRWAIGTVRVTPATLWGALEETLTSLALHHWDALSRHVGGLNHNSSGNSINKGGRSAGSRGERRCVDQMQELEGNSHEFLGLTKQAIKNFSIGQHKWTRGEYGLVSGPYDLLVNNSHQDICIHLHSLEAAAYTLLMPLAILKNYCRLIDQSSCVVVYGPVDSGKRSLVRCLASLKCGDNGGTISTIDLEGVCGGGGMESLGVVRQAVECGGVVVLEHMAREAWPALWDAISAGQADNATASSSVLVTMDSWRRPSGQLEGGVLWVQLRHDREPLSQALTRCLTRHLTSLHGGVLPSPTSHTHRCLQWLTTSWATLNQTLMTLGFSSALHGPHLFTQTLLRVNNPRDMLRCVSEVWNCVIADEIRSEVLGVWRRSSVGMEVAEVDLTESRITSMALYVVIQRSLAPNIPLPQHQGQAFLASLDGGRGRSAFRGMKPPLPPHPRPKDLLLPDLNKGSPGNSEPHKESSPQIHPPIKPVTSPTSPEWDEANLTKILGLSPCGYA